MTFFSSKMQKSLWLIAFLSPISVYANFLDTMGDIGKGIVNVAKYPQNFIRSNPTLYNILNPIATTIADAIPGYGTAVHAASDVSADVGDLILGHDVSSVVKKLGDYLDTNYSTIVHDAVVTFCHNQNLSLPRTNLTDAQQGALMAAITDSLQKNIIKEGRDKIYPVSNYNAETVAQDFLDKNSQGVANIVRVTLNSDPNGVSNTIPVPGKLGDVSKNSQALMAYLTDNLQSIVSNTVAAFCHGNSIALPVTAGRLTAQQEKDLMILLHKNLETAGYGEAKAKGYPEYLTQDSGPLKAVVDTFMQKNNQNIATIIQNSLQQKSVGGVIQSAQMMGQPYLSVISSDGNGQGGQNKLPDNLGNYTKGNIKGYVNSQGGGAISAIQDTPLLTKDRPLVVPGKKAQSPSRPKSSKMNQKMSSKAPNKMSRHVHVDARSSSRSKRH